MKNLIILFPILLSSTVFAQNTIDVNWMFSEGDSSLMKRIEINDLIDPAPGGIDVTWNLSLIGNGPTVINNSIHYSDVENFGLNSFSPITTIAALNTLGNDKVQYFNLVDNSLLYYGDSILTGGKRIFESPIVQFSFPMEFNQAINGFSNVTYYDDLGNFAFDSDFEISRTVDGIGTLITPLDTFNNCIRIKEEFITQPQSSTPLVYETYSWYYNKLSNVMAHISISHPFNSSSISWQTNLNQTLTNTQNISKIKPLILYLRNNEFQTKHINGLFSISVFDRLGKQLETKTIQFHKEGTTFNLDRFYQTPNMFFILFVNTKTNDFFIHKFIP